MENTTTNPDVLERFLRYVQINTQSEDANCDQVPSSTVQFDLANVLAEELRELGATDAHVTENAYVCAHIPASAGSENKPALGLIAHLDTTEVAPGAGVAPHIVHYEGGDLVCGIVDGKPVSMSTAKLPALNNLVGEDLVCSDGTTLLGADDKAGVAEIMALVARIAQDPSLPHPALGICFCPDEEIGHGAELLDIEAFGCKYAYTVDGGPVGELEWECFNAAEATVRFEGQSIHPGDAKGRMVNAGNLFCDFNALLPYEQRPEYTEGYEGFYHLEGVSATVDHATARYIVRDHDAAKFQQKLELMNAAAALLNQRLGEERVTVEIKQQYRNTADSRRHRRRTAVVPRPALPQPLDRRLLLPRRQRVCPGQLARQDDRRPPGTRRPLRIRSSHNLGKKNRLVLKTENGAVFGARKVVGIAG